jgi:hypothetical protein
MHAVEYCNQSNNIFGGIWQSLIHPSFQSFLTGIIKSMNEVEVSSSWLCHCSNVTAYLCCILAAAVLGASQQL